MNLLDDVIGAFGVTVVSLIMGGCVYLILSALFKTERYCEQILSRLDVIEKKLGIEKENE